MIMNNRTQSEKRQGKRLSVWALVGIDVLATCLSLGVFALFFFGLPRLDAGVNEPTAVPHAAAAEAKDCEADGFTNMRKIHTKTPLK